MPPPKTVVDELVKDLDVDGSGSIDEDEFKVLATVLCKNVASRVVVEMLFALVVGPLVAAIAVGHQGRGEAKKFDVTGFVAFWA